MAAFLQHHRLQPAHPILPSVALHPVCVTVPSPADQQGVNLKGTSGGGEIVMYKGFQVTDGAALRQRWITVVTPFRSAAIGP